ncbi:MAG: response regulator [Candidatus Heimdallarchaeota archaeon]
MPQVLLVDDDEGLLDLAEAYLAEAQPAIHLVTTTSGFDALRLLAKEHFDVAIVDYQMPAMDGLELLERLRAQGNLIPFIMFTGRGREEVAMQALNLGADYYLKKEGPPKALYGELAHIIDRIVEHKRTQQLFRGIFEHSLDVLYCLNYETYAYDFISPSVTDLLGITPEEIISMGPDGFDELLHPDDLKRIEDEISIEEESKPGKKTSSRMEYRVKGRDGKYRWLSSSFTWLKDSKGQLRLSIGIMRDITEYKEKEAALEKRIKELNCLYEMAVIVERPGISLNEILQESVELIPAAFQYPDLAGACITAEDSHFITAQFRESPWMLSVDLLAENKKVGIVSISYSKNPLQKDSEDDPFLKEEVRFLRNIALHLGGTIEAKRAEEKLTLQRDELSSFAHMMAHDLRNSLLSIEGYADALQIDFEAAYAERIRRLAKNMNKILQRSLALADAGLIIDQTAEVNLNEIVQEAAEIIIPDDVEFFSANLPMVLGDREKLLQMVQNLFENAVIHGAPQEISINRKDSMGNINLLISNDGKSIPPECSSKIFKQGFSTKSAKNRGLGLAIVRRIIEAHGWEIHLKNSDPPTFRISIPNTLQEFHENSE